MQTCYKNLVLGIVFCVSLFALNSSCVFAHNAAPTLYDITALKPGMEFTHRDLKYESLNKGQINNTEYVKTTAKIKKNIYDSYLEVGFSEDQALALMINDNIRLMDNIKKMSQNSAKKK